MNKKIKTLIVVIILLVLSAFVIVFLVKRSNDKQSTEQEISPPTEVEKIESDANKERIVEDVQSANKPGANSEDEENQKIQSGNVGVILSSYGQNPDDKSIEVSGFAPGIIENGGTCILKISGPTSASTTNNAFADAKNTNCGLLTIPASKLKKGNYTISVLYNSAKYQGASDIITLEVTL
ncbi:MAG: hypothetical protein M3Q34_01900 [bacterium]|nr:hypothetical protein [bacterium]